MKSFMILALLWAGPSLGADLRVGVVGKLAAPIQTVSYPSLQEALKARPDILAVAPGVAIVTEELMALPLATFVPNTPETRKIKNPNLILSDNVAGDLALALKVCEKKLFKSAKHVRACLLPHREKIYPHPEGAVP